jgi:hypothetical protein
VIISFHDLPSKEVVMAVASVFVLNICNLYQVSIEANSCLLCTTQICHDIAIEHEGFRYACSLRFIKSAQQPDAEVGIRYSFLFVRICSRF